MEKAINAHVGIKGIKIVRTSGHTDWGEVSSTIDNSPV